MLGEHHYRLHAEWTGARDTGTTGVRDYDRSVTVRSAGKPDLLSSADTPFYGDGSLWNPEELLLAVLSECHMLSYLYVCTGQQVVVVAYEDEATAVMTEDGHGGGAFTEVVLHPRVTVAAASMTDAAAAAHERAHELCFIANSVNFPVRFEPRVSVARAEGPA